MNTKQVFILLVAITGILCLSCSTTRNVAAVSSTIPSLKEKFKNDFLIGTALNTEQIEEADTAAARLVPQQFNAVTPENVMKAEIVHPQWGKYNFDLADKLVDYSSKHGLQVTATPLIWHSQLPPFLGQIKDADSVRQFFVDHITTVAKRYDGKLYSWEVVNEALNEDGTLSNSIFLQKLGPDYIVEAFRLAQKVAPHTKLYYNDYNIEQPAKRAGAIAIIKQLQAAGVRIDGVGIQGHWNVNSMPMQHIEQSIKEYSALGIQVAFTELDISVLPSVYGRAPSADISQTAAYNAMVNPFATGLPETMQQKLAATYASLFSLFLKYKDQISRVTFWGVNDGNSWLNDFPVPGRTDYPLLFDRHYQPKPAFYRVIETKAAVK